MKVLRILLIVVIVGFGTWYVSQIFSKKSSSFYALPRVNATHTEEWRTTKNEKFQFSFKHPSSFIIRQDVYTLYKTDHPTLNITDPRTNLKLLLDYKVDYGLTELGFSSKKHPDIISKPQLIRVKDLNSWTYYKRFTDGECTTAEETTPYKLKDGENNVFCYDVNFPFNWYFRVLLPQDSGLSIQEIKTSMIDFDNIIQSLVYPQ